MKITPIEIRQHTFDKGLRGYKTEDVDAFLISLSQEWERITSDFKMLKMQLEMSEKELGKLKEVEMTLFRTLKTAEDTSTQLTDQATKAGDQYIAEAKQKADDILADARKRSALMVQDAENQARYLKDNILNDLKAMEHDFKALETYKENLAVQIRTLASNATDSVDRFEKKFAKQNLMGKIDEVATKIANEKENSKQENNISHETPPVSNGVDELPPLNERETDIPEAIPVDDAVITKLDHVTHPHLEQPPSAEAVGTGADESQSDATAIMREEGSTKPNMNEPQPEVVEMGDGRQEKKSGSFFDQI
jgi:cell division initiation protein